MRASYLLPHKCTYFGQHTVLDIQFVPKYMVHCTGSWSRMCKENFSSAAAKILGTTSKSIKLCIFSQLLQVCSICSVPTIRASDRNVWGSSSLCTGDSNAAGIWESLHSASAKQTCMKTFWIICAHGKRVGRIYPTDRIKTLSEK